MGIGEKSAYVHNRVVLAWLAILFLSTLAGCKQGASASHDIAFVGGDVHRGEYLAKAYCCLECHTVRQTDGIHLNDKLRFAGGVPIPGFGGSVVHTANVTITSQYQEQLLDNIIRGRLAYKFGMPTTLYNEMAADDMRDIIAYLKTLEPIRQPLPDDLLPPGLVLPAPNPDVPVPEHAPPPGTVKHGEYLARMVLCMDCHSPRDSTGAYAQGHHYEGGGFQEPLPNGHLLVAQNLTSDPGTGLGAWSDAEIVRAIRMGIARDGRQLSPEMPSAVAFHDLTDQDVTDIVHFLRTLKPVNRSWPAGQ